LVIFAHANDRQALEEIQVLFYYKNLRRWTMEKIITITDKQDNLVVSLKIDWQDKTIEIINHSDYKVIENKK
jgi:hypothetical protein